jgi:hypothetical protein
MDGHRHPHRRAITMRATETVVKQRRRDVAAQLSCDATLA